MQINGCTWNPHDGQKPDEQEVTYGNIRSNYQFGEVQEDILTGYRTKSWIEKGNHCLRICSGAAEQSDNTHDCVYGQGDVEKPG